MKLKTINWWLRIVGLVLVIQYDPEHVEPSRLYLMTRCGYFRRVSNQADGIIGWPEKGRPVP